MCKLCRHIQKVSIKTLLKPKRLNNPKIITHIETYENISVNAVVDIYDNSLIDSLANAMKYYITFKIWK